MLQYMVDSHLEQSLLVDNNPTLSKNKMLVFDFSIGSWLEWDRMRRFNRLAWIENTIQYFDYIQTIQPCSTQLHKKLCVRSQWTSMPNVRNWFASAATEQFIPCGPKPICEFTWVSHRFFDSSSQSFKTQLKHSFWLGCEWLGIARQFTLLSQNDGINSLAVLLLRIC